MQITDLEKIMKIKFLAVPLIKLASIKLSIQQKTNLTIADNVHFAFSWNFLGLLSVKPSQVEEEITRLLTIIRDMSPEKLLEIGTCNGGTLYLFSKILSADCTIVTVDLPEGYPSWKSIFFKSFSRKSRKIHLVQSDSHSLSTLVKVKQLMHNEKIDVLFIDGDHSYDGVKKDFEAYAPLVRKGGIIIFHDIVSGPSVSVGGVPKFWSEVKLRYSSIEIIKNKNQGGFGLGVIHV